MILGVGIGLDGLCYPLQEEAMKSLNMGWEDLFLLAEQVDKELILTKELIHAK